MRLPLQLRAPPLAMIDFNIKKSINLWGLIIYLCVRWSPSRMGKVVRDRTMKSTTRVQFVIYSGDKLILSTVSIFSRPQLYRIVLNCPNI